MRLHYLAGRREDRLVFDLQTALARELGLADTPARRASEQLMQRYYRAAKLVRQVNIDPAAEPARAAVSGRHASRSPIDDEFRASTSCSTCATRSCSSAGPAAMLDAFLTLQRHPRAQGHVGAHAARAVAQPASRSMPRFRRDPANRARFIADLPRAARRHARAAADEPVRHPRPATCRRSAASSARCSTTSSTSTRSTSTS